jgi:periplasmic protein TonB
MNDIGQYEVDPELEQALYAALAREAAPATLIAGVEAALRQRQITASIPRFQPLNVSVQNSWAGLWSMGAHIAAAALVAFVVFAGARTVVVPPQLAVQHVEVKPFVPMTLPGTKAMGGGGGGGDRELTEASKGHLPKFADKQIAPPQLVRNDNPKIPVEPTVVMPKEVKLPDADLPNIGIPQSPQVALASQGQGSSGGFGTGSHGGMGPGDGGGIGPGSGGGTGGGVMSPGGGVVPPVLLNWVNPEFSDEARRAKYQGVCIVSLIVDEHGNPTHERIERSLGMGLDEKALEAVSQYRWKPALYKGKPVPVAMSVVVNFHIM